jgi:integrase/recombinase XerD
MPAITPMLDTRARKRGDLFPIVIYVYHKGQRRFINTGYKIERKHWDKNRVVRHPDAVIINSKISSVIHDAQQYLAECALKNREPDLQMIGRQRKAYSFNDYLIHRAKQYLDKDMIVMNQKCRRFNRELLMFFNKGLTLEEIAAAEKRNQLTGLHVYFDDINYDFLRDFDSWLVKIGNGPNTRHKKFEFLGKFYNEAMQDGKAPQPNPFKKYKISIKPVKKEKLSVKEIEAIENLKLAPGPVNDARNLFLFSYYTKGQRFENCVTLKKNQVHGGRVHFRTNKGNKYVSVKIHSRLQAILDYYKDVPGDMVFPLIDHIPQEKRAYISLIGSRNAVVNKNLKIVAQLAGITLNLSFHISRHSFAWHLKQTTDNIHVIQDSLAHSRSATTEIYLKALDDEALDPEMEKLYGR